MTVKDLALSCDGLGLRVESEILSGRVERKPEALNIKTRNPKLQTLTPQPIEPSTPDGLASFQVKERAALEGVERVGM